MTTTPSSPVDDCPRGMMAHLCVYIGLGIVVSVVVVLIVFLLLRRGQQTLARKPAWAFVAAVPILLFFAGMAAAVVSRRPNALTGPDGVGCVSTTPELQSATWSTWSLFLIGASAYLFSHVIRLTWPEQRATPWVFGLAAAIGLVNSAANGTVEAWTAVSGGAALDVAVAGLEWFARRTQRGTKPVLQGPTPRHACSAATAAPETEGRLVGMLASIMVIYMLGRALLRRTDSGSVVGGER